MSTTTRALGAVLLSTSIALGAVAVAGGPATAGPRTDEPAAVGATESLRRLTAPYRDVAVAEAAGYVPVSPCESLPGAGGMGVHYLNPALVDDHVVPARPEILLYEPRPDGTLELVGVEFFVPDPDQDVTTDDGRPSVFGVPFDGPMAGHAPGMPVHFDLHAWVWRDNPSGTFATWNPAVACPEVGDHH